MSNVYFIPIGKDSCVHDRSEIAARLLKIVVERENVNLERHIPLKVHFGEKGNRTWLPAEIYNGVIGFLKERDIGSEFIETTVLYGGERFTAEKHTKLALSHGFTQLPIVIADGKSGEDSVSVPVSLKHFQYCAIARKLAESPQTIVLAHFKGHGLAGFGGAIKQLSMGFAAQGGKLAMHMSVKPTIRNHGLFWTCKHCKLCMTRCRHGAIHVEDKKSWIDHEKCVGCGACFSICPHHAVSIFTWDGICNALFRKNLFREKLVEYAYASHHEHHNIYISFVLNVTAGCDCEPRPMKPVVPDIGVFASLDPVAIDSACWDAVANAGVKFKGVEQLDYAESIGLGTRKYHLVTLE